MTPCGLLDKLTLTWKKFFFALLPNSGLCCLTVEVSRSHTVAHTTDRTPLNEWSPRSGGRYLHNTQAQETNVHALSGARTRNPSTQAAADLRLRLHGHLNRLSRNILPVYSRTSMVKKSAPEDLCSTLFKNAGFDGQAYTHYGTIQMTRI